MKPNWHFSAKLVIFATRELEGLFGTRNFYNPSPQGEGCKSSRGPKSLQLPCREHNFLLHIIIDADISRWWRVLRKMSEACAIRSLQASLCFCRRARARTKLWMIMVHHRETWRGMIMRNKLLVRDFAVGYFFALGMEKSLGRKSVSCRQRMFPKKSTFRGWWNKKKT